MTWTKLGAEFPEKMAETGISINARYSHVELISYLYRIESRTGLVARGLLRRLLSVDDPEQAMAELMAAGLWTGKPEGFVLVHHMDVVLDSLDAQEAKRERDRAAQARARDKASQKRREEAERKAAGQQRYQQDRMVSAGVSAVVSADGATESSTVQDTGLVTASQTDRQTDKQDALRGVVPNSTGGSTAGGDTLWPETAVPGQSSVTRLGETRRCIGLRDGGVKCSRLLGKRERETGDGWYCRECREAMTA